MKAADLIIFDLDGTLIDSRHDITNAVNFTLRKIGLADKTSTEITSYIGRGVEDLIRKSLGKKQDAFFSKALSIFEEYYRQHCTDLSVLYPGVKGVLDFFRNKQKVIITNRKYEFAVTVLKATSIYDYFEKIIGADDTGCMKPSSCPLHVIMQRLAINKDKAIIVGDMDIDVLAGKNAGIATCAVTYGLGKRQDIEQANPDYIIDSISELKNLIY
jgi:phosphoglycolate phosphatase